MLTCYACSLQLDADYVTNDRTQDKYCSISCYDEFIGASFITTAIIADLMEASRHD
jgi:hypothetical protein